MMMLTSGVDAGNSHCLCEGMNFERLLMQRFAESNLGVPEASCDDEADSEMAERVHRQLDEHYDGHLEEAAATGFLNVNSSSALGKRYYLWRNSCEAEYAKWEAMSGRERKQRIKDWAKELYD
eukprot:2324408-Pyramimonas_sp.AAC.1